MASSTAVQSKVADSYNAMATNYAAWAESKPAQRMRYVDKLLSSINAAGVSTGARIVELGCGAGVPVTQYLSHSKAVGSVLANDLSEAQIDQAKKRIPDGNSSAEVEFVAGDMLELRLSDEEGKVDGVAAFYSIFHLPLPDQFKMLERVHSWLKPGTGYLVINFGATASGEKEWGEFFGEKMFWANAGVQGSLEMLKKVGFEIVEWEVLDPTEGMSEEEAKNDADRGVKFLWVLAGKKAVGN